MQPVVEEARDGSGTGGSVGTAGAGAQPLKQSAAQQVPQLTGLEAAQNYSMPSNTLLPAMATTSAGAAGANATSSAATSPMAATYAAAPSVASSTAWQEAMGSGAAPLGPAGSAAARQPVGGATATAASASMPLREARPSFATDASLGPRTAPLAFGSGAYGVAGSSLLGEQQGSASSAEVDVVVMAYAQWLSEMKQQASSARFQQKAELELMRDAISASTAELSDFKRQHTSVVQQLHAQVSDLRARVQDLIAEAAAQSRQRAEIEQQHRGMLGGLQEALQTRSTDLDTGRRTLSENLERLREEVSQIGAIARQTEQDMGNIKKALAGSQDQTIMKFGEVEQALNVFRNGFTSVRKELTDTKQDWKKGQDLLGQAISTLSQDFADFQKHSTAVANKLQSDVYHMEEVSREERERGNRAEAKLAGLQQSVFDTANEMILLRGDREEERSRANAVGSSMTSAGMAAQRLRGSASALGLSRPPPVDGGSPQFRSAGSSAGQGSPAMPKTEAVAGGGKGSSNGFDIEAFARPLSPQQDPRLARSVQKRFVSSTPPAGGAQPGPNLPQARGAYAFSRSPSPTHHQTQAGLH